MLHIPLTNLLLLAAKQEPYKKRYIAKRIADFSGEEKAVRRKKKKKKKKDKTETAMSMGRRTKEEIVKWDQMTAVRFQTRGGEDIRHPRPPFGGTHTQTHTRSVGLLEGASFER